MLKNILITLCAIFASSNVSNNDVAIKNCEFLKKYITEALRLKRLIEVDLRAKIYDAYDLGIDILKKYKGVSFQFKYTSFQDDGFRSTKTVEFSNDELISILKSFKNKNACIHFLLNVAHTKFKDLKKELLDAFEKFKNKKNEQLEKSQEFESIKYSIDILAELIKSNMSDIENDLKKILQYKDLLAKEENGYDSSQLRNFLNNIIIYKLFGSTKYIKTESETDMLPHKESGFIESSYCNQNGGMPSELWDKIECILRATKGSYLIFHPIY